MDVELFVTVGGIAITLRTWRLRWFKDNLKCDFQTYGPLDCGRWADFKRKRT